LCAAPPGVAQRVPALTALSERPCGVDRVARPRVGRLNALENLQDSLRALRCIAGDITKVLLAESNLSRFVRYAVLGANKTRVQAFEAAWNRRVSAGRALYQDDPRAQAIIQLQRGEDPFAMTTQMRTLWE
jgi:hypothetical protein